MAEDTITMEYTFGETEVLVTSVQAGKTHTSSLPPVRNFVLVFSSSYDTPMDVAVKVVLVCSRCMYMCV